MIYGRPACGRCDEVQAVIARIPKEVVEAWCEEGGLSRSDFAFAWQHAAAYGRGDWDYAAWYVATYAVSADDLGDLPDHPNAWLRYQEALATEEEEDDDLS